MSELLMHPPESAVGLETIEYPSKEEQAVFFEDVFTGLDVRPDRTVRKKGPLLDEFHPVFDWINERIREIDPTLTPEALFPLSYRSEAMREALRGKYTTERSLSEVADERLKMLSELATEQLVSRLARQTLPEGAVDIPPYASQSNALGCSIACYRMLFEAVAGWQPDETVLVDQLVDKYGGILVDDSVFHKTFETDAFKELTAKKMTMIDIIGADLACLGTLAAKMRARSDVSSVYCMVNLASIDDKYRTTKSWHKVALLGADGNRVKYHDPSPRFGMNFTSSYEMFISRWATTYNRAQLAIVRDLPAEQV